MSRAPLSLLLTALLLPAAAQAQTVGDKVPPYQAPPKVAAPVRDGADAGPGIDQTIRPDPFRPREDLIQQFAAAYDKGGRPRLAFYWNRQLSDTLVQWYSDSRTVTTGKTANSTEGDLTFKQSGSNQNTVETQRRAMTEPGRRPPPETWDWEFQNGFLAPFLQANAVVVDRTAILRIMGAGAEEIDPRTVEIMALQNMADLLVEVLVTNSPQATTGYELRARIIDVRTGRILAMVNSRNLRDWQRQGQITATPHGFDLPPENDDRFGPEQGDNRTVATPHGFEQRPRPPRLNAIAGNLAYNVMTGMMPRLESGPPAVVPGTPFTAPAPPPPMTPPMPPPSPMTKTEAPPAWTAPMPATPPNPPPPPIPGAAPPAPNQSAVPLPEVEAKPLPAPPKAAAAPKPAEIPAPAAEEPPMPRPTTQ